MKHIFSKENIIEWSYITIGIILMAFAYAFFLQPKELVTGGVGGLGIILEKKFNYDPAYVILGLNMTLLLIGLLILGKDFFIKTVYGSVAFPLFIKLFSFLYGIVNIDSSNIDYFLTISFASLLTGGGLGLVLKHGGTTGGVEIPQKILYKLFHMPYSISLYILDGIIIFLGYIAFGKVEVILYALIFLGITGFVMDTVIFSGFNKRAVYIISNQNEEITRRLLHDFDRGVTSIRVVGEFTKNEQKMLLVVLSSAEYTKLKTIIDELDPNAFYFAVRASEVRGEGFTYER